MTNNQGVQPATCDHAPEKFCEVCEPGLLDATKAAVAKILGQGVQPKAASVEGGA